MTQKPKLTKITNKKGTILTFFFNYKKKKSTLGVYLNSLYVGEFIYWFLCAFSIYGG